MLEEQEDAIIDAARDLEAELRGLQMDVRAMADFVVADTWADVQAAMASLTALMEVHEGE